MSELLDQLEETAEKALAVRQADPFIEMIERVASNPAVDVAKLEKIIDLQERILRANAESAFNAAFAIMQPKIPAIVERRKTNNGKYAPLEDINVVILPILSEHGFALAHRTEWLDKDTLKVVGILTHRDGHSRTSEFVTGGDESGNKNDIQGLGSAVTYGRRYTTQSLLNITTKDEDDDGRRAGQAAPQAPAGYDDWLADMEATADEGTAKLEAAWKNSKQAFRAHITRTAPDKWAALKTKAAARA